MKATEVFRFADHIGAIVHDTDDRTLHGVSWGSRRFYRWTLAATAASPTRARLREAAHVEPVALSRLSGLQVSRRPADAVQRVTEMRQAPGAAPFRLGGLDLIDLADGRAVHQVPLLL
jgi:hypothetical protein